MNWSKRISFFAILLLSGPFLAVAWVKFGIVLPSHLSRKAYFNELSQGVIAADDFIASLQELVEVDCKEGIERHECRLRASRIVIWKDLRSVSIFSTGAPTRSWSNEVESYEDLKSAISDIFERYNVHYVLAESTT